MDLITLALAKKYTDQRIEKAEMGEVELDQTLTKEGFAADAKAVGDAIANIELIPGPQGPQGPAGEKGERGEKGEDAHVEIDANLSEQGAAADARAVGDALKKKLDGYYYTSLSQAVLDWNEGNYENAVEKDSVFLNPIAGTITLLSSVEEASEVQVEKDLTINLQGHTLTFTTDAAKFVVKSTERSFLINGQNGSIVKTIGKATILDSCGKKVEVRDCSLALNTTNISMLAITLSGGLTVLKNVSVNAETSSATAEDIWARFVQVVQAEALLLNSTCNFISPINYGFLISGKLTVEDSVINATATKTTSHAKNSQTIMVWNDGEVKINNSKITSTSLSGFQATIYNQNNISINNSEIIAEHNNKSHCVFSYQGSNIVDIKNTKLYATSLKSDGAFGIYARSNNVLRVNNCDIKAVSYGTDNNNACAGIKNEGSCFIYNSKCQADGQGEEVHGLLNQATAKIYNTNLSGACYGVSNEGSLYVQNSALSGWIGGLYCHGDTTSSEVTNTQYINNTVLKQEYSGQFDNVISSLPALPSCLCLAEASQLRVFMDGVYFYNTTAAPYAIVLKDQSGEQDNICYISNSNVSVTDSCIKTNSSKNLVVNVGVCTNIGTNSFEEVEGGIFTGNQYRRSDALFDLGVIPLEDVIGQKTMVQFVTWEADD